MEFSTKLGINKLKARLDKDERRTYETVIRTKILSHVFDGETLSLMEIGAVLKEKLTFEGQPFEVEWSVVVTKTYRPAFLGQYTYN